MNITPTITLPARHSLTAVTIVSLLIILLTVVVSVVDIVAQTSIYPNDALRQAYLTNDIAKLVIGVPILLWAIVTVFGLLFLVLAGSELIDPSVKEAEISRPDLALVVADVMLSIALVIGGISLWRRQALGYVSGLGLLLLATTLFAGLILVLAVQPLLSDAPFAVNDIVVTVVMSLVAVAPIVLYLRGVIRS